LRGEIHLYASSPFQPLDHTPPESAVNDNGEEETKDGDPESSDGDNPEGHRLVVSLEGIY